MTGFLTRKSIALLFFGGFFQQKNRLPVVPRRAGLHRQTVCTPKKTNQLFETLDARQHNAALAHVLARFVFVGCLGYFITLEE